MKHDVIKLDGGKAGSVELGDEIFGVEPRVDILHRVVRWQRNNAQAGTHKVKTRSEVSYSTKKIYRQKGTGGARHGARSAPIFRGGGIYKGPTPRNHGHELPKKVRKMGLKMAISAKVKAGSLVIIDDIKSDGKNIPSRVKMRSPAFSNLCILPYLSEGWMISDVITILGSLDIVLGEIDR